MLPNHISEKPLHKRETEKRDLPVNNFVSQNRVGLFDIPKDFIEQQPEIVLELMKQVVVVRAEMMMHKNAIEYYGYSPLFDPVEPGGILYSYLIEYNNGKIEAHKQG